MASATCRAASGPRARGPVGISRNRSHTAPVSPESSASTSARSSAPRTRWISDTNAAVRRSSGASAVTTSWWSPWRTPRVRRYGTSSASPSRARMPRPAATVTVVVPSRVRRRRVPWRGPGRSDRRGWECGCRRTDGPVADSRRGERAVGLGGRPFRIRVGEQGDEDVGDGDPGLGMRAADAWGSRWAPGVGQGMAAPGQGRAGFRAPEVPGVGEEGGGGEGWVGEAGGERRALVPGAHRAGWSSIP